MGHTTPSAVSAAAFTHLETWSCRQSTVLCDALERQHSGRGDNQRRNVRHRLLSSESFLSLTLLHQSAPHFVVRVFPASDNPRHLYMGFILRQRRGAAFILVSETKTIMASAPLGPAVMSAVSGALSQGLEHLGHTTSTDSLEHGVGTCGEKRNHHTPVSGSKCGGMPQGD